MIDPRTQRTVPTEPLHLTCCKIAWFSQGSSSIVLRSRPRPFSRCSNYHKSGWAAIGAKGILASTMYAYAAADTILGDTILAWLRNLPSWSSIWMLEVERGRGWLCTGPRDRATVELGRQWGYFWKEHHQGNALQTEAWWAGLSGSISQDHCANAMKLLLL